ncbi:MAG: hypothetical protein OCC49_15140 [Fibrobacterales bacterium]
MKRNILGLCGGVFLLLALGCASRELTSERDKERIAYATQIHRFHAHISRGEIDSVDQYLNTEVVVNSLNRMGQSALYVACQDSDAQLFDKLMKAPLDVNVENSTTTKGGRPDSMNGSSLGECLLNNHFTRATQIINHGGKVDSLSPIQHRPLIQVLLKGDTAAAAYLLDLGAHINKLPNRIDKHFALTVGLQTHNPTVISFLFNRGANLALAYPHRPEISALIDALGAHMHSSVYEVVVSILKELPSEGARKVAISTAIRKIISLADWGEREKIEQKKATIKKLNELLKNGIVISQLQY